MCHSCEGSNLQLTDTTGLCVKHRMKKRVKSNFYETIKNYVGQYNQSIPIYKNKQLKSISRVQQI